MSTNEPPAPPAPRIDTNSNLQKWTLVVHASIVVAVVVATTILAWKGTLTADAVVGLYGTALGFSGAAAAYRTGVRHTDNSDR